MDDCSRRVAVAEYRENVRRIVSGRWLVVVETYEVHTTQCLAATLLQPLNRTCGNDVPLSLLSA